MKFILLPGFDNKGRFSDPLGLLGSDLFTEEDLKDEKYRPLITSAVNHLRNSNMKEAVNLKNTILRLHKEFLDTDLLLHNNAILNANEILKIKEDKKYSALLAITLCISLTANFNVSFNFNVDLNKLWDQIILLTETYNVERTTSADQQPTDK